jgi:hypothetical protein
MVVALFITLCDGLLVRPGPLRMLRNEMKCASPFYRFEWKQTKSSTGSSELVVFELSEAVTCETWG